MSIETVETTIRDNLNRFSGLEARYLFDFGDEGCLVVDAQSEDPNLIVGESEADCVISITSAHLLDLIAGKLNPTMAFATGKLKIDGDKFAAMKLQAALTE